jgi:hypothetical protein
MAKRKPKTEEIMPTETAEITEPSIFDNMEHNDVDVALGETVPETPPETIPVYNSPEWNEYVLKQFLPDELVQGNPTADGLRRVTEKLLGPIVSSMAQVIESASTENNNRATVQYNVQVLWKLNDDRFDTIVMCTEVADVYSGNTEAPYHLHPSSTAATRAEARALRKLLRLKKVVAAEELAGNVAQEDTTKETWNPVELIDQNQIAMLNLVCKRYDINLHKYINMGTNKYDSIREIPLDVARKMTAHINKYQNSEVPPALKGYEPFSL